MTHLDANSWDHLLGFNTSHKLRFLVIEEMYPLGALGKVGVVLLDEVPADLLWVGLCIRGG